MFLWYIGIEFIQTWDSLQEGFRDKHRIQLPSSLKLLRFEQTIQLYIPSELVTWLKTMLLGWDVWAAAMRVVFCRSKAISKVQQSIKKN